ncbi:hypothetical protein [Deinococcus sp. Leaf326]|uniref:hypothetical protein n=1 Tax=Deinococcus sp. Leaf326 TaxID=1736338 RepID=UPI0012E15339|nr:hypothetical protein [Deinococcus sp. Leaf326]
MRTNHLSRQESPLAVWLDLQTKSDYSLRFLEGELEVIDNENHLVLAQRLLEKPE